LVELPPETSETFPAPADRLSARGVLPAFWMSPLKTILAPAVAERGIAQQHHRRVEHESAGAGRRRSCRRSPIRQR
jgi:hypothetical protein